MCLLAAALSLILTTAALSPAQAHAANCTRSVLTIVAHQDDDLLFMNPDIENEIRAGACLTTVFLTAGDIGGPSEYWMEREKGPQSAYSTMLGLLPDAPWIPAQRTYVDHTVHTSTSSEGTVTLISMRLPDGGIQGNGNTSTGGQSLVKLSDGRIESISAVDGTTSYTRPELVATLADIVSATNPDIVRVQDARRGQSDHVDHMLTGQFAQEALVGANRVVQAYRGYGVVNSPVNVAGQELSRKTATLLAYAAHDPLQCGSSVCPDGVVTQWNERQYAAPLAVPSVPVPGPVPYGGPNVARNGFVVASSQAAGQGATKAIDSVIAGYPSNGGAEWSSDGQRAGAWLELSWAQPQVVDRVYLYDRPNLSDQVTGGVLRFSDGSTVAVPPLINNGAATMVVFPARATTTLRFTATSVSGSTANVGLAEIEVYNGDPIG